MSSNQFLSTALIATSLLLTGCNDNNNNNRQDNPADSVNKQDLTGNWYRAGYEEYWVVNEEKAELYSTTTNANTQAISWCYLAESVDMDEFSKVAQIDVNDLLQVDTGPLLEADDGPYFYQAIDQLPDACQDGGLAVAGDPEFKGDIVADFELLWHAFNSFYAYFILHEIDWGAAYEEIRSQIDTTTSPDELIDFVADVLAKTEDIHVVLEGEEIFRKPELRVRGAIEDLYYQFINQIEYEDFSEFALFQIEEAFPQQLLTMYLDQQGEFVGAEDEPVVTYRWGMLGKAGADNIGYLSLNSFSEFEPALIEEKKALDQAMSALQDTDALVIDVRNNTGGSFNLALYLAGFFVAEKTQAFNRQAYFNGGELAPVEPVFIKPSAATAYTKPVIILQNALSTSAAETFPLATKELPNVSIMGERSQGATASTIIRTLPFSGIEVTIPNDINSTLDGSNFEKEGIAVDIEVVDDRFNGVDNMLVEAIGILSE